MSPSPHHHQQQQRRNVVGVVTPGFAKEDRSFFLLTQSRQKFCCILVADRQKGPFCWMLVAVTQRRCVVQRFPKEFWQTTKITLFKKTRIKLDIFDTEIALSTPLYRLQNLLPRRNPETTGFPQILKSAKRPEPLVANKTILTKKLQTSSRRMPFWLHKRHQQQQQLPSHDDKVDTYKSTAGSDQALPSCSSSSMPQKRKTRVVWVRRPAKKDVQWKSNSG